MFLYIQDINENQYHALIYAGLIICGFAIWAYLYINYHENPMYRIGFNDKTELWYLEKKHWFGYTVKERFKFRETAEKVCTAYNNNKNLTK